MRAGFDTRSSYSDAAAGYGECPELAPRHGWEAIRVPSAAWQRPDSFCVPVFEAGRPRPSVVAGVLASASPTVALAVATKHAAGERPRGLGC